MMFLKWLFSVQREEEETCTVNAAITFHTDVPFQCLPNKFRLFLFWGACVCTCVRMLCILSRSVVDLPSQSHVNRNAPLIYYSSDCRSRLFIQVLERTWIYTHEHMAAVSQEARLRGIYFGGILHILHFSPLWFSHPLWSSAERFSEPAPALWSSCSRWALSTSLKTRVLRLERGRVWASCCVDTGKPWDCWGEGSRDSMPRLSPASCWSPPSCRQACSHVQWFYACGKKKDSVLTVV